MPYKDPERKKQYDREYYEKNKEIILEQKREYNQEHREKQIEYKRKRYQACKNKLIEKLGGKCIYCGCNIPEALEINHINGGGHSEYREKGAYRIYREILGGIYPYPTELVCKVCNAVHYLKMKNINGFKVTFNADVWIPDPNYQA